MNFKVGDKVKVRKDFSHNKSYGVSTNKTMEDFVGKILTVTSSDYMLESVPIEVGDTVRINKQATIEDIVENNGHSCKDATLNFIKLHRDLEEKFIIDGVDSDGDLKIDGLWRNKNLFELVSKKEPEIKDITIEEAQRIVEKEKGCKCRIIKEAE